MCAALGSLAQGWSSAWRRSCELVPPCPTPPGPGPHPTGLDASCSAFLPSVAAGEAVLAFRLGRWTPGLSPRPLDAWPFA